jgi:hypothetical protein
MPCAPFCWKETDSMNMHRRNSSPFYLRLCGLTGLIGCISVVATDIAGIMIYGSYNWISQTVSALAGGWIQDIGLYHLSVGLIAGAAGLFMWRRGGISWSIGCLLLVLLGADVFTIMLVKGYAGSWNMDPSRWKMGAVIHHYCVYALAILITLIPFCFAPGLWQWRPQWGKFSIAIGVSWIIVSPIYLFVPKSWNGVYERFLILLTLAWFAAVSDLLRRQGRLACIPHHKYRKGRQA